MKGDTGLPNAETLTKEYVKGIVVPPFQSLSSFHAKDLEDVLIQEEIPPDTLIQDDGLEETMMRERSESIEDPLKYPLPPRSVSNSTFLPPTESKFKPLKRTPQKGILHSPNHQIVSSSNLLSSKKEVKVKANSKDILQNSNSASTSTSTSTCTSTSSSAYSTASIAISTSAPTSIPTSSSILSSIPSPNAAPTLPSTLTPQKRIISPPKQSPDIKAQKNSILNQLNGKVEESLTGGHDNHSNFNLKIASKDLSKSQDISIAGDESLSTSLTDLIKEKGSSCGSSSSSSSTYSSRRSSNSIGSGSKIQPSFPSSLPLPLTSSTLPSLPFHQLSLTPPTAMLTSFYTPQTSLTSLSGLSSSMDDIPCETSFYPTPIIPTSISTSFPTSSFPTSNASNSTTSPASNPSSVVMDNLIRSHREHLRDFTEFGKSESKLLVNFSMSLSGGISKKDIQPRLESGLSDLMHWKDDYQREISFETYLSGLQDLMDEKLKCVLGMKEKIQEIVTSSQRIKSLNK